MTLSFFWRRLRCALGVSLLHAAMATTAAEAHAQGASLEAATDAQKAEAKDKYHAGMSAFGNQKYDEALDLFRASYAAVQSPNSHLMIARTLARQGHVLQARAEFEKVREEAAEATKHSDKYAQTASAAETEFKELDARVAFVRTTIAGNVSVAGNPVAASELGEPLAVLPGEIEVAWTLPDGTTVRQTVGTEAGETVDVELAPPRAEVEPAEPQETTPPSAPETQGISQRTLGYAVGGIGVGGFAMFGIFGALNKARFNDLEAACPDGICPPGLAAEAEQGRRFKAVANAGLGIGLAGLATGFVLVLTAPRSSPAEQASAPTLRLGPRSVSVSGKF